MKIGFINRIILLPWFIKTSINYTKGMNPTIGGWIRATYRWVSHNE